MLGELEDRTGRMVVADLEAGVGTVSRLGEGQIDLLLLVVEPYAKSIEVGRRARSIALELGIPRLMVVASRVVDESDMSAIVEVVEAEISVTIPDDLAVVEADRIGLAPIDHAPGSPVVTAVGMLADELSGSAGSRN